MTATMNSANYNHMTSKSNIVNIIETGMSNKTSNKGLPLIKQPHFKKHVITLNKSVEMNRQTRYK